MTKTKIVFLDFDGVMITRRSYREPLKRLGQIAQADPECVEQLNRITNATGAHIVVTSTHRHYYSLEETRVWMKAWGVKGNVTGYTPGHNSSAEPRGMEIQEWLDKSGQEIEVESIVILDDNTDMAHLLDRLV